MNINLFIQEVKHYWSEHKKVVLSVAALIIILVIL